MGYPCVNSTATIVYLNDPAVREALHIPRDLPDTGEWRLCSYRPNYQKDGAHAEMTDYFLRVLVKNKRILMYYGEADIICNYLGGRWFVQSLNQPVVKEHTTWRYFDKHAEIQVGGGVEEYRNLLYVSVKGAGHFVPKQTADKAFFLFRQFITNTDFTNLRPDSPNPFTSY
ncbi:hypothetical protein CAPTEDRAFT_187771 [Capitella teleta]|uniref:Uncharacterized protein n=1 Tax=Capitella teleta TaxID=283909 RepID=R7UC08_CAPTE|nr:hypothetical protein CAPTEDRAFT_187771 [Capitella teleta]|eukprot:ELU03509.1 hypothetical protein CAPTEDRAFT_187771 [Capitella teleta]